MYHLLRKQVILLVIAILLAANCFAQPDIYRPEHDDIPYYFGISLGYTSSYLHPSKARKFLQDDSVLVAEPGSSGGITLGLSATGRLSDHFQVRFNPQLIIGGSMYFSYTLNNPAPGEPIFQKRTLPTLLVSFPFQLKFNSDRINNFRTYLVGGIKYDMDLAGSSSARKADDLIKIKSGSFGIEGGIGFNFFLPFVTLSPEIKFSYGITDIHDRNPDLKYSSVFDKIQSRMIVFTLHFEH